MTSVVPKEPHPTHIYTNGTNPLRGDADLFWVSMDGLPDGFAANRGDHFHRVEDHVRRAAHLPMVIIYTVNAFNHHQVRAFLEYARRELPVIGVIFYFHTPYYGVDELFLDAPARARVIDELLACRRAGLPVFNSPAALKALKSGRWVRPNRTWVIVDASREYVCCRYPSAFACEHCGYTACTELTEAQKLRPSAVWNMLRMM